MEGSLTHVFSQFQGFVWPFINEFRKLAFRNPHESRNQVKIFTDAVMGSSPENTVQTQFVVNWESFLQSAGPRLRYSGCKCSLSVQDIGFLKEREPLPSIEHGSCGKLFRNNQFSRSQDKQRESSQAGSLTEAKINYLGE